MIWTAPCVSGWNRFPWRAIMGIYHGFACVSAVSTWLAPGPMPHRFRP